MTISVGLHHGAAHNKRVYVQHFEELLGMENAPAPIQQPTDSEEEEGMVKRERRERRGKIVGKERFSVDPLLALFVGLSIYRGLD